MIESRIFKEMRPKGLLRDVIKELGIKKGAYIIVSGHSSTSYLRLSRRRAAMKKAVSDFDKKEDLFLDFYDCDRLATWVRCHPSMVIWVKEKIGSSTFGWQAFRNWSRNSEDIDEEFLIDCEVRIYLGEKTEENKNSIIEGMNLIRKELSNTNSSVRFVGLSGFGKTRLLQALFDERIGNNALNYHQVIYGDSRDKLTPDPQTLAQQLVAFGQPIILAVDNCSPDLHRRLTTVCKNENSLVKLITVEYDIKEDQPEETKVFRLGKVSDTLLEQIIYQRCKHIGSLNIKNIVEFSGGNSRIALALANTIELGESIGHLKDEDLFKRLFFQRNTVDNSLMYSAEVCSLIYSFNISTSDGEDEEMILLSKLAGKTKNELFRDISILMRRDLVQQKNKWRAVLPHAMANKLAVKALGNIPLEEIIKTFEGSSERLLKSFAYRLNFLQKSPKAKEIASIWLSGSGFLGSLNNLNAFGIKLLNFIALLSPEVTLNAIERAILTSKKSSISFPKNHQIEDFSKIIGAIAYDGKQFERCINILLEYYFSGELKDKKEWLGKLLESLFYIVNSKTHAPLNKRISVVLDLIKSSSDENKELGLRLLNSLLKTRDHHPFHNNPIFNKHFKDFGFNPKQDKKKIDNWYSSVLNLCESLIKERNELSEQVKSVIAENIRSLCSDVGHAGLYDQLERIFRIASNKRKWIEGWISLRETIRFSKKKMLPEAFERLEQIEQEFRPTELIDLVRAYAFSKDRDSHALLFPHEVAENDKWIEVLNNKVKNLGIQVSQEEQIFNELLPELVSRGVGYRIRGKNFGEGLGFGTLDPMKTWKDLKNTLLEVPDDNTYFLVICGFLLELSRIDTLSTKKILDEALKDEHLIKVFPILQSSVDKDREGWNRIIKCLEIDKSPIYLYRNLLYSNFNETTYHDDLCDFLEVLISKDGGIEIAIDLLASKVFARDIKILPNKRIKSFARKLLTKIEFKPNIGYLRHGGYQLAKIIDGCFESSLTKEGEIICDNFAKASFARGIYLFNFPKIINSLARQQPLCFLNSFLGNEEDPINIYRVRFNEEFDSETNPISFIKDKIIFEWCEEKPSVRYPIIAPSIKLFQANKKTLLLELTPLSLAILQKAPDVSKILSGFQQLLRPSSWSGSLIDVLSKSLFLLNNFKSHKDPQVVEWANRQEGLILQEIESIKKRQDSNYRMNDERFEY